MRIAFIGTGSMGGALLEGVLASGQSADDVHATSGSRATAEDLAARLGVHAHAVEDDPQANEAAVRGAGLVFVGVKPWMLADTAAALARNAAGLDVALGAPLSTHPTCAALP